MLTCHHEMKGACVRYLLAILFVLTLPGCSGLNRNVTYPDHANMLRITGEVTIGYNVNAHGLTEDVRVLKAEPSGVFEKNLLKDVRGWRFEKDKPRKNQIISVKYGQN